EREWQAVEARLDQAMALQQQGRWLEARVALEAVPSQLSKTAPADLRERLRQARADADVGAALEEVRLSLSGPRECSASPDKLYAEAFRGYGIALTDEVPTEAASRVRNSAVRETILAYLHDWHFWAEENRHRLQRLLDLADDDEW